MLGAACQVREDAAVSGVLCPGCPVPNASLSPVQSLLSSFSQLYHSCICRIRWLEQEGSAPRSHVTSLRGERSGVNQASVPVRHLFYNEVTQLNVFSDSFSKLFRPS